jgi:hypothetical protein
VTNNVEQTNTNGMGHRAGILTLFRLSQLVLKPAGELVGGNNLHTLTVRKHSLIAQNAPVKVQKDVAAATRLRDQMPL